MRTRTILCAVWLASAAIQADAQPQAVYRCGNAYGAQPCEGGAVLRLDESGPSPESASAARAAALRDAKLAEELEQERQARENAAAGAVIFRSSRMSEPEAAPASKKSGTRSKAGSKGNKEKDFSAVSPRASTRDKR
jgi:hypothetical protein